MDLDGVGDIFHRRSVGRREAGLFPDLSGNDALQKQLGVDDRDSTKLRVDSVFPEIVLDNQELKGRVGNGHLQEGACLVFLHRVGVLEEG